MTRKQSAATIVTSANIFLGPVLTYPDIFESATFSFRIRLLSTRIRQIRQRIRIFFEFRSPERKKMCNKSDDMWAGESGYFRIR